MKIAGGENPNHGVAWPRNRAQRRGGAEQISLDQVGCEAEQIPAEGDVFFLDFSFYRTYQDLTRMGE